MNRVTYSSLIPFSTINKILISIERSNFGLVFLKADGHANPGAERNFSGSGSYYSRHIFPKFSNTSADNNLLMIYNNVYSPKCFISKSLQTSFACA